MANTKETATAFSLSLARFEFVVERSNDPEDALFMAARLLAQDICKEIEAAALEILEWTS